MAEPRCHIHEPAETNRVNHRKTTILATMALVCLVPGAALAGDGGPCGDLDYEGRCMDERVQWCEDGELHETDCSEIDRACGWDDSRGFFQCVPDEAPAGSCPDDLSWTGRCEKDDRVVWCQDGAVQTLECTDGARCGWNAEGFYDCVVGEGQSGSFGGGDEPGAGGGAGAEGDTPNDPAKPAPKGPTVAPSSDSKPTADKTDDDADTTAAPLPKPPANGSTQPAFGCSSPLAGPPSALGLLLLALAAVRRRARA